LSANLLTERLIFTTVCWSTCYWRLPSGLVALLLAPPFGVGGFSANLLTERLIFRTVWCSTCYWRLPSGLVALLLAPPFGVGGFRYWRLPSGLVALLLAPPFGVGGFKLILLNWNVSSCPKLQICSRAPSGLFLPFYQFLPGFGLD